jgi:hypothetical protein
MLAFGDTIWERKGVAMKRYHSPVVCRSHIYAPELKAWKIQLTRGKYALVDEEDFDKVKDGSWYAHPAGNGVYARWDDYSSGSRKRVYLHRLLLGFPKGAQIDHANCDTLDNRKSNLRLATKMLNSRNKAKPKFVGGSSSRYKGVSFDKKCQKWHAYIEVDGKRRHLGRFVDEHDAGKAYNEAAKQFFGEFAFLNEIETT